MKWHSLHIYYHHPQDRLLVDCIGPLMTSLPSLALTRWFFLRYWKGGSHIRLRMFVEDGNTDETLGTVRNSINEYLAQKPSRRGPHIKERIRQLAQIENDNRDVSELVPDNTVQLDKYEPEGHKYGGELGVKLAETLFAQSSAVALEVLSRYPQSAARFGLSFVMMLAGLKGVGLSKEGIAEFLAWYSRFWFRYIPQKLASNWPVLLAKQEPILATHAAAVLYGHSTKVLPAADVINRWASAMQNAAEALDARASDILPSVSLLEPDATSQRRRAFVLLNYLHTHNNRLGVPPAHEGYLAYLGHEVVSRLIGLAPQKLSDFANYAA